MRRLHFPSPLQLLLLASILLGLVSTRIQPSSAATTNRSAIALPTSQDTYKIAIASDGIYEISYADLQAAGMSVDTVNPNNFVMMVNGETVSFELIGDSDTQFEAGEKVRFYAWAFDGSRHDAQYVTNNIFWLWANGSSDQVAAVANQSGSNPIATAWRSSVTAEENNTFSNTFSRWLNADNEPDAWYWDYLHNASPFNTILTLPHPASTSGDAAVVTEVTSLNSIVSRKVSVSIGSSPIYDSTWSGLDNRNIGGAVAAAELAADGQTSVKVDFAANLISGSETSKLDRDTLLNRITVDYWRLFIADNNELTFNVAANSAEDYAISGLSEANINNFIVWDISTRTEPKRVTLNAANLSGGVLRFGRNSANGTYIVTTKANSKSAISIERYNSISLDPAQGAEWVAITHADFASETQRLATYRHDVRNMSTHVVDFKDVMNQYGYGLPIPSAIHDYMQHGYDTWATKPAYLLLVGDATQNPLQRNCASCTGWDSSIRTFVPADLIFEDRFLGLIPSDHTFGLLAGNDIVSELAIGRIAARTAADVTHVVDKTIRYEEAVLGREGWIKQILFAADNTDSGGNFCQENNNVATDYLPADNSSTHYCLDDYLDKIPSEYANESSAVAAMRSDIFNRVASNSTGIFNYRGHGSIHTWAQNLINRNHGYLWANDDRPTVILSADCLDSNFVWVEAKQSLSETFLMQEDSGSAAHWGSTGLGYSHEHTVLHVGFYDALHVDGNYRIGDAILHSKANYHHSFNGHSSEIYAFTLHGDPALQLDTTTDLDHNIFLPIITR